MCSVSRIFKFRGKGINSAWFKRIDRKRCTSMHILLTHIHTHTQINEQLLLKSGHIMYKNSLSSWRLCRNKWALTSIKQWNLFWPQSSLFSIKSWWFSSYKLMSSESYLLAFPDSKWMMTHWQNIYTTLIWLSYGRITKKSLSKSVSYDWLHLGHFWPTTHVNISLTEYYFSWNHIYLGNFLCLSLQNFVLFHFER